MEDDQLIENIEDTIEPVKWAQGKHRPKKSLPQRKTVSPWKENTEETFYAWLNAIKPQILVRKGVYEVFEPNDEQRKVISAVFEHDDQGKLKHSMVLSIMPRRHGKSTLFAVICLFFFVARRNFTISLLGTTEEHSDRTMLKKIKDIVLHTPALKQRIDPGRDIIRDHIRQEDWGNLILKAGQTIHTSFGERVNLLWCSDLHAAQDITPFNALQASLLDSEDSLILIDSNADSLGGPVHALESEALEDPSIYCRHVQYEDFAEFKEKAPLWIDRGRAQRIQKTALEVDFQRDILGKRTSVINRLFPDIIIHGCTDHFKMPVSDIESLAHGRPYVVGGGLDRAKNLIAMGNSDFTVWSTVMKVASLSGEPEYYILNQRKFMLNTSREIKAQVLEDHKKYKFTNCVLENYEVVDLESWFASQNINVELISAHDTIQNASFPELHRIMRDGRLHIPEDAVDLKFEMSNFIYQQRRTQTGGYSFGHSSQKFHDDHVYSLNWAIYALREEILDMFSLSHISCPMVQAYKRAICFMFGGSQVLGCANQCQAYREVLTMYQEFKGYHALDSELTIDEFYRAYVKNDGFILYQGV